MVPPLCVLVMFRSRQKAEGALCGRPCISRKGWCGLHANRVLAANRDRSQSVESVGYFSGDDAINLLLNTLRDRADCTAAHADLVNRAHGSDFCGSSGEEHLVRQV